MASNMGRCCASEEIDEVIKRDGQTTLSFDKGSTNEGSGISPTVNSNNDMVVRDEEFLKSNRWSMEEETAAIMI